MPDIPKFCVKKCVVALDWERRWELFSFDFYFSEIIFSLHCFVFYVYCIFLLRNWNLNTSHFPYVKGFNKILAKKMVKLKFIKEYAGGKQNEIGYGEEKKFCFKIVPSINTPWWHSTVMLVIGKWIKKFNIY